MDNVQVDKKPAWAEVANDIVVQELRLMGSRCGPFPAALDQMQDSRMRALLDAMVDHVRPPALCSSRSRTLSGPLYRFRKANEMKRSPGVGCVSCADMCKSTGTAGGPVQCR